MQGVRADLVPPEPEAASPTESETRSLNIELQPITTTSQDRITLADIAIVRGDQSLLTRRPESIDLCMLEIEETKALTQEFILLRLALADYPMQQVCLKGASTVYVHRSPEQAKPSHLIHERIRHQVARITGLPPHQIRVNLLQTLDAHTEAILTQRNISDLTVQLPDGPILGRRQVNLSLHTEEAPVWRQTLLVEIAVLQTGIRVKRPLAQGEVIQAEHLVEEEMILTSLSEKLPPEEIVGKAARRNLRAGEKITAADLQAKSQAVSDEIVVRPRDALRLIATHKNLRFVVPQAEALQSGRIGQIIRVRNLESNRVVHARIISNDEAVVDLQ